MQNRYVGDVGDFGKYGLLRALCGADLKLGILWYLTNDESHNDDGKHVGYLDPGNKVGRQLRECDPELHDHLRRIVACGMRNVGQIQARGLFPMDTVFHANVLDYVGMPLAERPGARSKWLEGMMKAAEKCEVVFLDPDNGLEVKSVRRHSKMGPKYAYYDDLALLLSRDPVPSIVVYHHIGRSGGSGKDQIETRMRHLTDMTNNPDIFALYYHRGSARAFIIVPSVSHRDHFRSRLRGFCQLWQGHFDYLSSNSMETESCSRN